jgi:hypothetical protein
MRKFTKLGLPENSINSKNKRTKMIRILNTRVQSKNNEYHIVDKVEIV